jgi:hypothetical protein
MISYNDFAGVPENGIICKEEGAVLRVYFDIKPHEPVVSDNEPEEMRNASSSNGYVCENVNVAGRTYSDIVSAIVNDRYSADDVQALQANFIESKDSESTLAPEKREEYLSEYAAFQAWRKRAKEVAQSVIEMITE